MSDPIAFARPFFGAHEAERLADVIDSGWVAQGPQVREFEEAFAQRVGAVEAVAVSSGTTALHLALHAAGIGPGDEVVVPSLSFIATANSVRMCGATPVFADVQLATQNLDPAAVEQAITPKTKAIMPVDQLGLPADLDSFRALADKHRLVLIEDAACALGSRIGDTPIGGSSHIACFSLHARKVITTGEGGMITVADSESADRLRRLRHHGMSVSDLMRHESKEMIFETYDEVGFNYRLTDLQAALGLAQLELLDQMLEARAQLATDYTEMLADLPHVEAPSIRGDRTMNWQSYAVMIGPRAATSRDDLIRTMAREGIATRRGVMSIVEHPAYEGIERAPLPNTELITRQSLLLPLHPSLTQKEQERVVDALRRLT